MSTSDFVKGMIAGFKAAANESMDDVTFFTNDATYLLHVECSRWIDGKKYWAERTLSYEFLAYNPKEAPEILNRAVLKVITTVEQTYMDSIMVDKKISDTAWKPKFAPNPVKPTYDYAVGVPAGEGDSTAWAFNAVNDITTDMFFIPKEVKVIKPYPTYSKNNYKKPAAKSPNSDSTGLGTLRKMFDLDQYVKCKECGGVTYQLSDMVIHWNDRHRWTRNKIADELERLDINIQMKTPSEA